MSSSCYLPLPSKSSKTYFQNLETPAKRLQSFILFALLLQVEGNFIHELLLSLLSDCIWCLLKPEDIHSLMNDFLYKYRSQCKSVFRSIYRAYNTFRRLQVISEALDELLALFSKWLNFISF